MLSVTLIQIAILSAITGRHMGNIVRGTQMETTCRVAQKRGSGSITCYFSMNLNVTKQDFSVRRSRLDGRDAVWVVDCTWVSSDRTKCFINPSYTFSGEVSQEAVIHIPELREEHETRYWCHVVPLDYSLVETCSFQSPDQSAGLQRRTENRQNKFISNNDNAHDDTSRLSPGAKTSIVVLLWLLLL